MSARPRIKTYLLGLTAGLLYCADAAAINGYFLLGYGAKQLGVAGVGVALPQDRLAAAINPAGMALVAPGFDAGLALLNPRRGAEIDCRGIGACDTVVGDNSRREFFQVPSFGYSRRLDPTTTLGLTMYANGGLNSTYDRAIFDEAAARIAGFPPPGGIQKDKLGLDMAQFVFAPSLSRRLTPNFAVGIAPLFQIERVKVYGLQSFARLSTDPTSVSNRGSEYLFGGGVRVGFIWSVWPRLQLGAQFSSPIYMQDSIKYNGLFAQNGSLDVPAHFTVGLAYQLKPTITLAFDYQNIRYGDIDAIANPAPTLAEFQGHIAPARKLGGSEGIGFGWRNQNVYRLAGLWTFNPKTTLRLGYSHCSSQLTTAAVLINVPLPSVIPDKLTAGVTYEVSAQNAFSLGYMHGFAGEKRDPSTELFGASAKLWASGDTAELAWHHTY
ncbi:MAG: long-chain fatty acid transporter [Gammaproteobacteria bacterium]|nr:long-chain fatty acid transporter [Gammaproteobacteria bacterium]